MIGVDNSEAAALILVPKESERAIVFEALTDALERHRRRMKEQRELKERRVSS